LEILVSEAVSAARGRLGSPPGPHAPGSFAFRAGFWLYVRHLLPLYAGLLLSGSVLAKQLTLQAILFALLLLAFIERHRATKEVAAKLGISLTDASKIMSTPTWRSAVWQRGPAASLLCRATSAATTNVRTTDGSTTLTQSGDRPAV
jgi:hypothetical protein